MQEKLKKIRLKIYNYVFAGTHFSQHIFNRLCVALEHVVATCVHVAAECICIRAVLPSSAFELNRGVIRETVDLPVHWSLNFLVLATDRL